MLTAAVVAASLFAPPTIDDCWRYYYACIDRAYAKYLQDNDSDDLINAMGFCWDGLETCFYVVHNDAPPWGIPLTGPAWDEIERMLYP